jgi:hypothetical protein
MAGHQPISQNLSGSLDNLSLIDVVRWACASGMNRNIYLDSAAAGGTIAVRSGQVVSAVVGDVSGEEALKELVLRPDGAIRSVADDSQVSQDIRKPWEQLLIETLQDPDEEEPASGSAPGLSAQLAEIDLSDLVQLACLTDAPRDIRIVFEKGGGLVCFREGRVTHARFGDLAGENAFRQLMVAGSATFESLSPDSGQPETIDGPVEDLLAGAMRFRAQAAGAEDAFDEESTLLQKLQRMKVSQKIKLALTGNRETRGLLMRENNRMIQLAVLSNKRLTESEVMLMAANKQADEEALRRIAASREWMRLNQVRAALVKNPRCPLSISTKLVQTLGPLEWKLIAASKSIPSVVSQTAKRLIAK